MSIVPEDRRARGLYWSRAWSLVSGCTKQSPGCENCWAEAEAHTKGHQTNEKIRAMYGGLTDAVGRWTGTVRYNAHLLNLPLRTAKPQAWAIWTDLFHDRSSDRSIAEAFGVMAVAGAAGPFMNLRDWPRKMLPDAAHPHGYTLLDYKGRGVSYGPHVFLVLTKRIERAQRLLSNGAWREDVSHAAYLWAHNRTDAGYLSDSISAREASWAPGRAGRLWPLPNVWIGTTCENQKEADRRIGYLQATPAAHRWISAEPLLGPIHRRGWPGIDLVIAGGESGKSARPCHPSWARSLRDQCADAGVAFVWKQWGEYCAPSQMPYPVFRAWDIQHGTEDWNRDDPAPWRIGKRTAGRMIDDTEHFDLPW